jgi:hypothetical protein
VYNFLRRCSPTKGTVFNVLFFLDNLIISYPLAQLHPISSAQ